MVSRVMVTPIELGKLASLKLTVPEMEVIQVGTELSPPSEMDRPLDWRRALPAIPAAALATQPPYWVGDAPNGTQDFTLCLLRLSRISL